ncbi:MAG: alginate export family protein [Phycisphaerae bacterium]
MNNSPIRWIGTCLVLLCAAAWANAQQPAAERSVNIYEEQLRVRLDEQIPDRSDTGFRAGGWLSAAAMHFDDAAVNDDRDLRKYQLRGWLSFNYKGVHRFYVRGLLNLDEWSGNDNPAAPDRGDDFEERIERAWYQFDYGAYYRTRFGEEAPFDLRVRVGRSFATMGTSLVLAMPLDMIELNAGFADWHLKALWGETIHDSHNIDRSAPVAHRQERCFYGVELAYEGFDRHRPFAYYLAQFDHTTPDPGLAGQRFDYSSRYVGVGSEGSFLDPGLRYRVELVGEWGRTYSAGATGSQDRICAWAGDAMIEYNFDCPTQPRIYAEYLFGTGDSDRTVSAVSTLGGNTAGTVDNAFNAFGFRDTGIAFAPALANLHIWSLGGSFFPLEDHKWFEKMEVGTKAFLYYRVKSSGAISDTTVTSDGRYVGWEMDVFCNWRITSDLSWTVRYGFFNPGDAYDGGDKTCRQFVYTGLVLSF